MAAANPRLLPLIDAIAGQRVVVLGDLMLDEYVFGEVSRISPEAPVPVVDVDFDRHDFAPGGATNVAYNLRSLGAEVVLLGVVGNDPFGKLLRQRMEDLGVDTRGVLEDPSRPTTRKTRVIAHTQQVVRVDRERCHPLAPELAARMLAILEDCLRDGAAALLISDYNKGMLCGGLCEDAIRLCRARRTLVTANPKPANLARYRGATAITLNHAEAEAGVGRRLPDEESLRIAGEELRARLELEALLVTRGSRGMMLVEREGCCRAIPAAPVEVYDVVGAGDTAFSTLTLSLAAGAPLEDAATLANLAGGAVVRKVGTAVVTPDELRAMAAGGDHHAKE